MARGKDDVHIYGPTIRTDKEDGERNIFVSTSDPSSSQGREGDIWIKYTA